MGGTYFNNHHGCMKDLHWKSAAFTPLARAMPTLPVMPMISMNLIAPFAPSSNVTITCAGIYGEDDIDRDKT